MSTFYLLPPRPLLRDRLAGLLPGLDGAADFWSAFVDLIGQLADRRPGTYVVFREELPDGEDPARALADGFGAEDGDEVIEVRPGPTPGELTARRWRLAACGTAVVRSE
ncbi:MAG TPA: hypothetical protein VFA26_03560 [Gemmataceae bacterium]|nr:hypothetical protein [Gemmataceae bacterium]